MNKIQDFRFDPVHSEEIAVITKSMLSVFSNQ